MSRPLRLEYEGAWYHVMNRGASHQRVFLDHADYKGFLSLLEECRQLFALEIHAYALLVNHYHLLLRTPRANLSKAMRHLGGVYTQRFNRRHKKDGPLFRGRFKAIVVDAENYLLQVARYIHLNPVKAGFARCPEDFPWSSYHFYLDFKAKPAVLMTQELLGVIGGGIGAIREMKKFTEAGIDPETDRFYRSRRCPSIFGKADFIKAMKKRLGIESGTTIAAVSEIPSYQIPFEPLLPGPIIELVSQAYETSPEEITQKKTRRNAQARAVALYLCRQIAGMSLAKVANIFGGCRYSAVSNTVSKVRASMQQDKKFQERLLEIEEQLRQNNQKELSVK